MFSTGEHSLYDYRLQSGDAVLKSFIDLISAREELEKDKAEVITKLYDRRVLPIYFEIMEKSFHTPLSELNAAILQMVDIDLIRTFLRNPKAPIIVDRVVEQLAFVCAGTGIMQESTEPYDQVELLEIAQGKDEYYSDATFLYTMNHLVDEAPNPVADSLISYLAPIIGKSDVEAKFGWDEAVLTIATLHAVWSFFPSMEEKDAQFLLQNCFYAAVVCGIPVRFYLKQAVGAGTVGGKLETVVFLRNALNGNKENVPVNIQTGESKTLSELSKSFFARIASENISSLTQEKFITELYKSKQNSDAYGEWLREALNMMLHVKNGDVLEY